MPKSTKETSKSIGKTTTNANEPTKHPKKKITRERSRRNKTTRVNYGMYPLGGVSSKRKDIQYSNYAKKMETKGDLFVAQHGNNDADSSVDEEETRAPRSKTRVVRFKKDAKVILERVLIVWLGRIAEVCKTVCNQEGLTKIKERNVYTQIRMTYPPSEQNEMINYCKRAMRLYIASKVAEQGTKKVTNAVESENVQSVY